MPVVTYELKKKSTASGNFHSASTQEQFREAFLNLDIPDDDIAIANKNLSPEVMEDQCEAMPITAQMNFRLQMQERGYQIYHAGQYKPNNLLNPFAWASFIKAWKRGDLKEKFKLSLKIKLSFLHASSPEEGFSTYS